MMANLNNPGLLSERDQRTVDAFTLEMGVILHILELRGANMFLLERKYLLRLPQVSNLQVRTQPNLCHITAD